MPEVDPIAFGRRVRERREELGERRGTKFTQGELAEACGMSQQNIGMIENGRTKRPGRMLELAAALETTQEWLLWAKGPKEIPVVEMTPEEVVENYGRVSAEKRKMIARILKSSSG